MIAKSVNPDAHTRAAPVPAPLRAHVPERGQCAAVGAAPHGAGAAEYAQPKARVYVAEQSAVRRSSTQRKCRGSIAGADEQDGGYLKASDVCLQTVSSMQIRHEAFDSHQRGDCNPTCVAEARELTQEDL